MKKPRSGMFSVTDDLLVISLCNYPILPPVPFPVTWIGFDIEKVCEAFVAGIDRQRSRTLAESEHLPVYPETK